MRGADAAGADDADPDRVEDGGAELGHGEFLTLDGEAARLRSGGASSIHMLGDRSGGVRGVEGCQLDWRHVTHGQHHGRV